MRESYTAVVERNVDWQGVFAAEPYEAAWADEALFFVRVLDAEGVRRPVPARVQISPDGMRWVDEGTVLEIPAGEGLAFARVRHFGSWLRLAGEVEDGGRLRVIAYLCLKG